MSGFYCNLTAQEIGNLKKNQTACTLEYNVPCQGSFGLSVVSRQPDCHLLSFGAASALFESGLSWQLKQKFSVVETLVVERGYST